ncbi:toll/interleukin-1 receptor domain-containing protein [Amycolatopsis sp.]|uniref:toll/interleukin-1 receptor domain-containing protein n=1 Tax=Amycolatopsis sp. TaxID=37632 RepID=UPI002BE536D3|nr:toll/interleukin-1 receptor domain-containing protein [Amycolatopsis sp.]HVV12473.1 toll/interleukin-1 receptor domain-containing protein [Amycolatopsis sp.]
MQEVLTYDIAVSFAGEQREYVAAVVAAAKDRGLNVFYDKNKGNEWWGNNFVREQRKVYGSQTRFFVPFISKDYLTKSVPMDEFSAAMMTAVKQGDGYILPVLMGDVQVPPDLLHPHIHYLRSDDFSPEALAEQLAQRVGVAASIGQQPRDVSEVVKQALSYRLPKVTPADFSKYDELDATFEYLRQQFDQALPQLASLGLVGRARVSGETLKVRIERHGETAYGIDITKGGFTSDDQLNFVVGMNHMGGGNSSNGHATPYFDRDAGQPKLKMMDFSVFGSMGRSDQAYTKEELFHKLWDSIVDRLERV